MALAGTTDLSLRSVHAPPPDEEDLAAMREFGTSPEAAAAGPTEVAPSSVPLPTSLSPDALMAYCQSRLNSLDDQMNNIFASQTANAKSTQDVNAIAAQFNDLPPASGNPAKVNVPPENNQEIMQAYNNAIADAKGQLLAELTQDRAAFNTDVNKGNGSLTPDDMTQLTTNLKNYAADLNSDSEMTMITLQSLMSQRQTAVQLTTNLVQSLGDQQNSIAKNIGQ